MNAMLSPPPPSSSSAVWAALRLWAARQRDRLPAADPRQSDLAALIALLNAQEDLRGRHPVMAAELGKTARTLANKIAVGG